MKEQPENEQNKSGDESSENLRLENELLKLKMRLNLVLCLVKQTPI